MSVRFGLDGLGVIFAYMRFFLFVVFLCFSFLSVLIVS